MSTVAEIENAMQKLSLHDKLRLLDSLGKTVAREQETRASKTAEGPSSHSILDIPGVSVGAVLLPDFKREDLLNEMVRERF